MVESALVMLTLLGMVLFIMDFGRILLMQQYIAERAQATVRAAAVNNWSAANVANYLVYDNSTAPGDTFNNGSGSTVGLMGLTTSEVSYATVGTSGASDYLVQVTVSGVPAFEYLPYIAGHFTLPTITATAPAQSLGATN